MIGKLADPGKQIRGLCGQVERMAADLDARPPDGMLGRLRGALGVDKAAATSGRSSTALSATRRSAKVSRGYATTFPPPGISRSTELSTSSPGASTKDTAAAQTRRHDARTTIFGPPVSLPTATPVHPPSSITASAETPDDSSFSTIIARSSH